MMTSREGVASTTYVASVLALPAHLLLSSTLGAREVFLQCVYYDDVFVHDASLVRLDGRRCWHAPLNNLNKW